MKMEDIARMAQVSKSAVSIALSGKSGISTKTRDRILKIVKDTGYLPRSMVKADQVYGVGKALRFVAFTNSGIVLEQYYKQPFFLELIHFVEEHCRLRGYSLLFSSVNMHHFEEEIEKVANENNSTGLILLGTNLSREQIVRASHIHPHTIVLDANYENLDVNFIVMNNMLGAYQAAEHLRLLGHTHIGYVRANSGMFNFDSRRYGFETALKEHKLKLDASNIFTGHPTMLSAQEELKDQWVKRTEENKPLPTALFCECDYLAISMIKTFGELGINVPEDISIMGFDNINEAMVISPELTTIHVEKEQMAILAVDRLLQMIENKNEIKMKTLVDTKLVERKSCARLVV